MIRSSVVVLRGEDELPCYGVGVLCHLFGRTCGYEVSAEVAAVFAEVDYMVCLPYDIEIVFDDDDGVSLGYDGIDGVHKGFYVVCMQSRRRLVEDEKLWAEVFLYEERGKFDALVLASRQCRGCLSEFDVADTYVLQRLQTANYASFGCSVALSEECYSLIDSHLEYIVDIFAFIRYVEYVAFEASSLALFAYERYVSHKLHGYGYDAFAFADVAASAVLIEREMRCRQVQVFGCLAVGEELAYLVVCLYVGGGVRTARFAYRRLIDKLHSVDEMQAACQSVGDGSPVGGEVTVQLGVQLIAYE